MFGNYKRKEAKIGKNYQTDSLPLVTNVAYFEHLQEQDSKREKQCTL